MKNKCFNHGIVLFTLFLILGFIFSNEIFAQETISVIKVIKKDFRRSITALGNIRPVKQVKIQAKTGGKIDKIYVKENDKAKKNQLLLNLENDTQKFQVELSQLQIQLQRNSLEQQQLSLSLSKQQTEINIELSELALNSAKLNLEKAENPLRTQELKQIQAGYEEAQANLKDAQRRLEEEQFLYKEGSTTKSQLELVKLQYTQSKAIFDKSNAEWKLAQEGTRKEDLENLKIQVIKAEASLKLAKANRVNDELREKQVDSARVQVGLSEKELQLKEELYDQTLIHSPILGVISQKYVEEGEFVGAGTLLFEMINIDQVEIEVGVSEEDLPLIKKNSIVFFTTPAYPNLRFKGKIDRISWTANPQTRRFEVIIIAENHRHWLRSGMTAQIKFIHDIKNVIIIPAESLLKIKNKYYVYIAKENKAVLNMVYPSEFLGEGALISKGLNLGDLVITEKIQELNNGDKVIIK